MSFALLLALAGGLGIAGPAPLADEIGLRVDLDASWGIGSQMFLGTQVHVIAQRKVWSQAKVTGSFDFSLRLAYGNEPAFFAPWIDPQSTQVNQNRLQAQIGLGHALHFGKDSQWTLGLYLLGGYNGFFQEVEITYAEESFAAEGARALHSAVFSGELNLAYRLSRFVGINLAVGAPLPTQSSYVITMVHTSLGLSFYVM